MIASYENKYRKFKLSLDDILIIVQAKFLNLKTLKQFLYP